jgi:hypothetical protein
VRRDQYVATDSGVRATHTHAAAQKKMLALLTGGTIGLRAVPDGGGPGVPGMVRADVAREVIPATVPGAPSVPVDSVVIAAASGAELTLAAVFATRDRILAERDHRQGFLVRTRRHTRTHGARAHA